MGFWPFRWGKDESQEQLDYLSGVVSEKSADGALMRAKLTVHFAGPLNSTTARSLLEKCERGFREHVAKQKSYEDLLGTEAAIASVTLDSVASAKENIRTVEVLALHVVGEPPARAQPVAAPEAPPARSLSPISLAPAPRFASGERDEQFSAVPSARPQDPTQDPDVGSDKLGPRLREEATRLLVAILRGYDILVVRDMNASDAEAAAETLISQPSAGQGAESQSEELGRWEERLSGETIQKLQDEVAVTVTYLLQTELAGQGVTLAQSTEILAQATKEAFPHGVDPVRQIGRYLIDNRAAFELADAVRNVLSDARMDRIEHLMAPILASVRENLSRAAEQIRPAT